jgi:hypothetical protein
MSYEAVGWVLKDAPGVPAQCVSVLIGLADHADKRGRGSYPSAATLAEYARKSERQVRYDLRLLTEAKLIRPGNQELVKKFPVNRRPVVYDLAMERSSALGVQPVAPPLGVQPGSPQGVQSTAPQDARQPIAPQTDADLQEQTGVQSGSPQGAESLGCNTAQFGVQPTADKPPSKPPVRAKAGAKHELADALTAAFWDRHQGKTAQSFIAIRGIVRTAIANGLPRNDVAHALDKLARECIGISGASITNALREIYPERYPKVGSANGRAPGPDRARGWVEAGRVAHEAKQARGELPHG